MNMGMATFDSSKLDHGRVSFLVCGITGDEKSDSTMGYPVLALDSLDGSKKDDEYPQSMFEKCQVFFYCVEMTTVRFTDQDKSEIELLTEKFGAHFWERAVVVMILKCTKVSSKEEYLCERFTRIFRGFLAMFLAREGVSRDIAKGIHFHQLLSAGIFQEDNESERFISYASDTATAKDDVKDFLPELWAACSEVTSGDCTQNALTDSRCSSSSLRRSLPSRFSIATAFSASSTQKEIEEEQQERLRKEKERLQEERERQLELIKKENEEREELERQVRALEQQRQEQERERKKKEAENRGAVIGLGAVAGGAVLGPVGALAGGFLGKLFS